MEELVGLPGENLLPQLPIDELRSLCRTEDEFKELCRREQEWFEKFYHEAPLYARIKPAHLSWEDYYQVLSEARDIPLYYQGDHLTSIPFDARMFEVSLYFIHPYLFRNNLTSDGLIVFIDQACQPIIVVKYPSMEVDVRQTNFEAIQKVLFFSNPEFDSTLKRKLFKNGQQVRRERNREIIFDELTSLEGRPPIYGVSKDGSFQLDSKNRYRGRLYILHHKNGKRGRPKNCEEMTRAELQQLFDELQIKSMETTLCETIYHRLKELGHLLSDS